MQSSLQFLFVYAADFSSSVLKGNYLNFLNMHCHIAYGCAALRCRLSSTTGDKNETPVIPSPTITVFNSQSVETVCAVAYGCVVISLFVALFTEHVQAVMNVVVPVLLLWICCCWCVDDVKVQYELCCVVMHHGQMTRSGHYTAVVKCDLQWLMCDDEQVRWISMLQNWLWSQL